MLRKFLTAAVFLCAAGCLAGCQGMENGTAGSGQDQTEKTTLVWAVWDTGQLPFVQDVIDPSGGGDGFFGQWDSKRPDGRWKRVYETLQK